MRIRRLLFGAACLLLLILALTEIIPRVPGINDIDRDLLRVAAVVLITILHTIGNRLLFGHRSHM